MFRWLYITFNQMQLNKSLYIYYYYLLNFIRQSRTEHTFIIDVNLLLFQLLKNPYFIPFFTYSKCCQHILTVLFLFPNCFLISFNSFLPFLSLIDQYSFLFKPLLVILAYSCQCLVSNSNNFQLQFFMMMYCEHIRDFICSIKLI